MPRATENATKHDRYKVPSIESLNAVPDDADDCAYEDEEVGAVHAHDRAREDGAIMCERLVGALGQVCSLQTDVVLSTWSSHEDNHDGCEKASNTCRDK